MDSLGENLERSNLYLKLFKLVFGSVTLFAQENELMLKVCVCECTCSFSTMQLCSVMTHWCTVCGVLLHVCRSSVTTFTIRIHVFVNWIPILFICSMHTSVKKLTLLSLNSV